MGTSTMPVFLPGKKQLWCYLPHNIVMGTKWIDAYAWHVRYTG